jgi:hypothetical protein
MKVFKRALSWGWVVLVCMVLVSIVVPQGVRPYLSGVFQVLLPIWALVTAIYIAARFTSEPHKPVGSMNHATLLTQRSNDHRQVLLEFQQVLPHAS